MLRSQTGTHLSAFWHCVLGNHPVLCSKTPSLRKRASDPDQDFCGSLPVLLSVSHVFQILQVHHSHIMQNYTPKCFLHLEIPKKKHEKHAKKHQGFPVSDLNLSPPTVWSGHVMPFSVLFESCFASKASQRRRSLHHRFLTYGSRFNSWKT